MDFDIAVDMFAQSFDTTAVDVIKAFRPTQSRLRLEQLTSTTTTSIKFPVQDNQGNPFITEVRLNQSDSFVPTSVGFFLANPTGTTDSAFKLFTYVNPFFFNAAMTAAYNGIMNITIAKNEYLSNWPLMWHWKSTQTQQTAAAGPASPVDQCDGDNDGLKGMQPFVLLIGSQNIEIEIEMPTAPTAITANSRYVLVFDGILFQNSTVVS